jgi:Cft2 family RNA processing exonuclease
MIRYEQKLPVIMAYSLGKAQEAMVMLGEMGYKIFVHSSAWKLAEIYRKFEIEFPNCSLFDETINLENDILMVPPHLVRHLYSQNLPPFETIFLSGWAEKSPSNHWISADYALPLSDHADFDELIEFVKRVNPQKVFTLHGFPDFPNYLKEEGFEAEYLQNEN